MHVADWNFWNYLGVIMSMCNHGNRLRYQLKYSWLNSDVISLHKTRIFSWKLEDTPLNFVQNDSFPYYSISVRLALKKAFIANSRRLLSCNFHFCRHLKVCGEYCWEESSKMKVVFSFYDQFLFCFWYRSVQTLLYFIPAELEIMAWIVGLEVIYWLIGM